jgi:hypothetical protein
LATQSHPDNLRRKQPGGKAASPHVLTDLPDMLEVTEAELDFLESYLSDLVTEMLNQTDKTLD